jgi:hypothetical protein
MLPPAELNYYNMPVLIHLSPTLETFLLSTYNRFEALLDCAGKPVGHETKESSPLPTKVGDYAMNAVVSSSWGEELVKKQYNMHHTIPFLPWNASHIESLLPILLRLVREHFDDACFVKTVEQCSRLLCTLSSTAGSGHRQQMLGEGHKEKEKEKGSGVWGFRYR